MWGIRVIVGRCRGQAPSHRWRGDPRAAQPPGGGMMGLDWGPSGWAAPGELFDLGISGGGPGAAQPSGWWG